VTARDETLARIRTALGTTQSSADGGGADQPGELPRGDRLRGEASPDELPRSYRLRGEASPDELSSLFAERLTDYRATVLRTTQGDLGAVIARTLARRGVRRVVVPPGLDLPPLPAGVQAVADDGFSAAELDSFDGAITGAAAAIAETGTIILDGSPGQGRRAITLVPDYHLCIIHTGQIVALVPEAIERLTPDRPLTWISGPSATSDIELQRIEGVHGPRTLDVILVEPSRD